jgi:hypothetical protein
MSVVGRGAAGVVVAGIVLLGGPAWAQEDPCAPGPDGSVPEMCQSGMPVSDTPTVGIDPGDPCPAQPVEPGDGIVSDDDQGIAVGEPNPGAPTEPEPEPVPEGDPKPERVDPEQVDPAAVEDAQPEPDAIGPDTIICAFGVPVSAQVADGVLESAAGGGATAVDSSANGAVSAGQLPRTGPYDRVLAVAAIGSGLLVAGAGAAAAGRRRRTGTA